MDHERARADFMGFLDGDLPDEERLELVRHLEACEGCRAEWEAYSRTVDGVSGLRVIEPPEGFTRQISSAIEMRGRRRQFGQISLTGVRLAVLSLVLIMLLVMAYLTYLLLFNAPEPTQNGAKTRDRGDFHIIGPVKVETKPEPDPKR